MEYRRGLYRDVVVHNLNEEPRSRRLADHFVLGEFACKDGSPVVLLHPGVPLLLEAIRERMVLRYGDSVWVDVTNGFRSVEWNKKVGGKSNSRHLFGFASDIKVFYKDARGKTVQVDPDEVADVADEFKVGGVGRYDTFTHVDVYGENRRWDERTNAKGSP